MWPGRIEAPGRKGIAALVAAAALSVAVALSVSHYFNQAIIVGLIKDTAINRGLDPDGFVRMAKIESGFDPYAFHPISKASGLFQFLPDTARQYRLKAVFDARANANAAATLWLDNSRMLRKGLGRRPTSAELYLAHQQGATGAIKLLSQPDRRAIDIVGYDAVTLNGGSPDMTAHAFASMWIERFQKD
jgi:hypothetical protein